MAINSNQTAAGAKVLRTITSHAGVGRFYAESDETPYVVDAVKYPRDAYHYSQTRAVSMYRGQYVIVIEVSHRRYQIIAVASDDLRPRREDD